MSDKPVLVVCARRYNGHELWTALGVIQSSGIPFEVVSQRALIEDEVTGQRNTIGRTVYDVPVTEFRERFGALMIVSGNMQDTESYWKDAHVQGLVTAAHELGEPLGAICCSVPTLRPAVRGRKVSFFPLVRSREILERAGAILQSVAWTVDGPLVTAEHQMASQMWAESFVKVYQGIEVENTLVDSKYMPQGRRRKPLPEIQRLVDLQRRARENQ